MDATKLRQGLNSFGWKLFRSLSGQGNVVVSPHSVTSALMLACVGAKGETEKQILAVIGATAEEGEKSHELFKSTNETLSKESSENEGVDFTIANKLYAKESMEILETFIKESTGYYGNTTDKMDFGADPEACRQTINGWVEEQTKEKIKDLLPGGSLTAQTNLVLVNAIYFKGKWGEPFKAERTAKADFNVSASEKASVDMMHTQQDLPFVANEELKCRTVSINYMRSGISMIIALPDQIDGLSDLESALTPEKAVDLCSKAQMGFKAKVDLALPKFSMTETSDLAEVLPKLGIADLFDAGKVDLSGLSPVGGIAISDVIHKSYIEVSEEGTEAAAATAMIGRMMVMPMDEQQFVCDRPFLFFLADQNSGALLFVGRFSKPAE